MATLYVANTTQSEFQFNFRLPEEERASPHMRQIRAGGQVAIEGLSEDEIQYIIDKNKQYGFVPANSIGKSFAGLCYAIGKPVPLDAIHAGLDHVQQAAVESAAESRKAAAVAADAMMTETARQFGINQPANLSVEVIEEAKGGVMGASAALMNETIQVQHEGTQAAKRGRK